MLSNINIWQFIGGLGLFLFAMHLIENALSTLGSKSFNNFLIRHTDKPVQSVLSGGLTTAMLQSSSLVGLLVLAFTGAGLMSLNNALGVIFGSNLGTTMTGWIVATIGFKLDLDALSLPLIALGSFFVVLSKGRKQQVGMVLASIGLLLLGLEFMKDSVSDLKTLFDINSLRDFSAIQFLLFGAVFAAVVQSSSATMIIALAALDGGIISLPSAAAVAIGADLGTTSTIVIGATNGTPNKKRVAAAHVIFNVVTDLIAFILLMPLLQFIIWIGIKNPLYSLVAFHTLFNLIGIILF
ncbi:MAG: Na/Pi symporter, partial [Gammaproteobacteria bacterium]|nr:Na/Pi symporter [Gammaproteobacteria bacterium]